MPKYNYQNTKLELISIFHRRQTDGGNGFDAYVVSEHIGRVADFDGVGDVAEDGSDPEEHREAAKKLFAEFDPFRRRFGRRQGVGSIPLQVGLGLSCGQSLPNVVISPLIIFFLIYPQYYALVAIDR